MLDAADDLFVAAAVIRTVRVRGAWTSILVAERLLSNRRRSRAILFGTRAFVLGHGDEAVTIPGGYAAVRLRSTDPTRSGRDPLLREHGLRAAQGPQFVERLDEVYEVLLPVLPIADQRRPTPPPCERRRFAR